MFALPIAGRELLVLSRATTTWRGRVGMSAMVFVLGVGFALVYHYAGQMAMVQGMRIIGAGLSIMCLFAGVSLTADSIAEEKRAGTIGLLFLTHQSPFQILLGKLVAHGVVGFYMVLCVLPLLSMSMIFGGMRFTDVVLGVFAALNIFFFSAAVGLLASSICREKKRASTLGVLIVLFFWQLLPIVALVIRATGGPRWLVEVLAHVSLNLSRVSGIGAASLLPSTPMWWQLAWPQLAGWAIIAVTTWWLPSHWHDEPARKRWSLRELWNRLSLGGPVRRLKLRRKLLDRNPFMWLASRDRLQALGPWIMTLWMLIVFGGLFAVRGLFPEMITAVAIALALVQQATFSGVAGGQLFREYEQGTLELVLSTPLSTHEVIRGQFAAALRHFRSILALLSVMLCASFVMLALRGGRHTPIAIAVLAIYCALLVLQFYTLGWVGMWSVTKAPELKQPKRVSANAFFFVVMLPGVIFGFIVVSVQFLCWLTGIFFSPGPVLLVPFFFILAFANTIYWLRRAKRELPRELRRFAFRRYTPSEPITFFGAVGRFAGRLWGRLRLDRDSPTIPAD